MDRSELDIIKELMAELESKMEPGKEDFEERLGRGKPEVKVLKIEGDMPMSEEEGMEKMSADGLQEGMMGEEMMDEEMSPESKLKARLMKLRS